MVTSIADEWDRYSRHFKGRYDQRHTFYMACLTMMTLTSEHSPKELESLAIELDEFMKTDEAGCLCDSCKAKAAHGEKMFSMIDTLRASQNV